VLLVALCAGNCNGLEYSEKVMGMEEVRKEGVEE
jgi:hypothetical protein